MAVLCHPVTVAECQRAYPDVMDNQVLACLSASFPSQALLTKQVIRQTQADAISRRTEEDKHAPPTFVALVLLSSRTKVLEVDSSGRLWHTSGRNLGFNLSPLIHRSVEETLPPFMSRENGPSPEDLGIQEAQTSPGEKPSAVESIRALESKVNSYAETVGSGMQTITRNLLIEMASGTMSTAELKSVFMATAEALFDKNLPGDLDKSLRRQSEVARSALLGGDLAPNKKPSE